MLILVPVLIAIAEDVRTVLSPNSIAATAQNLEG
jgi:hypothetical protein